MKQSIDKNQGCSNCKQCGKLVVAQEKNVSASQKTDNSGLYAAEAMTYYYYYAPVPRKAS